MHPHPKYIHTHPKSHHLKKEGIDCFIKVAEEGSWILAISNPEEFYRVARRPALARGPHHPMRENCIIERVMYRINGSKRSNYFQREYAPCRLNNNNALGHE